jgi:hypothetical protein
MEGRKNMEGKDGNLLAGLASEASRGRASLVYNTYTYIYMDHHKL